MKLLSHLEKNKSFWWLIGLCALFFILRVPSVIEPYWYGDEGIYQVIGQAMHSGWLLYRDIWDNKPPLLYLVYAIANGDQMTVRFISLFAGVFSLAFFFLLAQKLFMSLKASVIASLAYIILFATPLLEGNIANAENFILLPVIAAAYIIYSSTLKHDLKNFSPLTSHHSLLVAGFLLGLGFLFKIVAVFDLAAFFLFLLFVALPQLNKKYLKESLSKLAPLVIGFVIPFLITIIYFALNNALPNFIQAAFFGNISYVGWQNNFLGIPQGLLMLKLLILGLAVVLLFLRRKHVSAPMLFIILWLLFSLFNTFFSGRPYTHYVLGMLPSFCLLLGFLMKVKLVNVRLGLLVGIVLLGGFLSNYFHLNVKKTFAHYNNTYQFVTGHKSVTEYQAFFDGKTPRDYEVASFINSHTKSDDTVFIWGNNPQIYSLTHKLPPYKYTVAYHITQNKVSFNETQQAINKSRPKYIIVLKEAEPLPFVAPLYIMRFKLEGATIYERSL